MNTGFKDKFGADIKDGDTLFFDMEYPDCLVQKVDDVWSVVDPTTKAFQNTLANAAESKPTKV
jgi:hypothetical protein